VDNWHKFVCSPDAHPVTKLAVRGLTGTQSIDSKPPLPSLFHCVMIRHLTAGRRVISLSGKQPQECSFCHVQWWSCTVVYVCINAGYPPPQQPMMTQQNYPSAPPGTYPTQPQPTMQQQSYPAPPSGSYPTQQLPSQSADPNAPPNYAVGKSSQFRWKMLM